MPKTTQIREEDKQKDGKLRMSLLPIEALEEIIKCREHGVEKYKDPKSLYRVKKEDLLDAAYRHIFQLSKGNRIDSESGLHHSAHAITNLLFYLHAEISEKN